MHVCPPTFAGDGIAILLQVTEKDYVWLEKLLDFYTAVLEHGEIMPAGKNITVSTQQPRIPAEVYTIILAG